ncbi:hypothetical protein EJ05DRAFT_34276 [Pseudovirgaria hyperparasitica]|uniref:Uncharacterized protein n=1 Tax=Pseudovirgaria hyperparasitica TaxID=470096 RepID=A0A6A6WM81_9PEZI|nr:uncharacterized protein EJ05DRAFT_34276 [Pseudovirgaria hyperparasitica]KAF2763327.1 hypothetical protein EJ05DRAFT_34276 [Pseudovirgaria hyperparasitica]
MPGLVVSQKVLSLYVFLMLEIMRAYLYLKKGSKKNHVLRRLDVNTLRGVGMRTQSHLLTSRTRCMSCDTF